MFENENVLNFSLAPGETEQTYITGTKAGSTMQRKNKEMGKSVDFTLCLELPRGMTAQKTIYSVTYSQANLRRGTVPK